MNFLYIIYNFSNILFFLYLNISFLIIFLNLFKNLMKIKILNLGLDIPSNFVSFHKQILIFYCKEKFTK